VNVARVSRILEAQFPELRRVTAAYLGEGYDSTVFEVNEGWVFRFPKRADVEDQLLVERRILPILSQTSPLPLPAYRFFGQPSPEFPRSFVGYPRIPGTPGILFEPDAYPHLAAQLGRFFSWLHSFSVHEAARHGVPRRETASLIEEIREEALADFESVRKVAQDAPLAKWHAYLKNGIDDGTAGCRTPVLVHHDLAGEHVLVDTTEKKATGVIDWSDIAISDPAVDFAGMFHWGGARFVEQVLSAYMREADGDMLQRARFIAACRGTGDVVFGLKLKRPEYISAGLRALRLLISA